MSSVTISPTRSASSPVKGITGHPGDTGKLSFSVSPEATRMPSDTPWILDADMTRIALIGASGQLGTDLHRQLVGEIIPIDHTALEITQPDSIRTMLDTVVPTMVVNTAAYNLVDKAESEPDTAMAVNAWGVKSLAEQCGSRGITLVHIGTDFVFGLGGAGRNTAWTEEEAPGPESVYAASKLLGEYFVRSFCPQHFVIRTCGLYGRAATKAKGNFVQTMLRLARERPEIKVVSDQRCVPSYTRDVAEIIAALIPTKAYGLYHATNSGGASWYEVAREAVRLAGLTTPVTPITSAEFPAKAKRPANSWLDCHKIETVTGRTLRPWQAALAAYLQETGDLLSGVEGVI